MTNDEFKAIIEFAVNAEMEQYQFYKEASIKVEDEHLKGIFRKLAADELEHKEFLQGFLDREVSQFKIGEVPDYNLSETIEKPKLTVQMKFVDAIALAIKNEEESMDLYKSLSDSCLDKEQKLFFLELAKMEQMHKSELEDIYINIAYNEVW